MRKAAVCGCMEASVRRERVPIKERLRIQRGSRVHLGRWREGLRPRLCTGALALGYAGKSIGRGVFVGPRGGRVSQAWGTGPGVPCGL